MKNFFKNKKFKKLVGAICLILVGALISATFGHSETLPSTVVGTVFKPFHYVATKISSTLDTTFGNISGNEAYEKQIAELQDQIDELQSQLVDYENLKNQNEIYKDFLELKEDNPDYEFVETTIIARDSADIYQSFTVNKGSVSGIKTGDAVLYGSYLVGVVEECYPTYSVIKTILDPDLSVSAYEIVSNEISYVTGTTALAQNSQCKMANLGSSTKIAYGSIIATAGIGSSIPKGLIIGTVEKVDEESTNISSYAVVTPGVEISEITSCFVLINYEGTD